MSISYEYLIIYLLCLPGLIYDFEVDLVGETWVVLHWNITPSDYPINYYDLSINGVPSQHVTCHDVSV